MDKIIKKLAVEKQILLESSLSGIWEHLQNFVFYNQHKNKNYEKDNCSTTEC